MNALALRPMFSPSGIANPFDTLGEFGESIGDRAYDIAHPEIIVGRVLAGSQDSIAIASRGAVQAAMTQVSRQSPAIVANALAQAQGAALATSQAAVANALQQIEFPCLISSLLHAIAPSRSRTCAAGQCSRIGQGESRPGLAMA